MSIALKHFLTEGFPHIGACHCRGDKILDKFVSLGGEKANAEQLSKVSFPQKLQKPMHSCKHWMLN